jgi:hypothetical protein
MLVSDLSFRMAKTISKVTPKIVGNHTGKRWSPGFMEANGVRRFREQLHL